MQAVFYSPGYSAAGAASPTICNSSSAARLSRPSRRGSRSVTASAARASSSAAGVNGSPGSAPCTEHEAACLGHCAQAGSGSGYEHSSRDTPGRYGYGTSMPCPVLQREVDDCEQSTAGAWQHASRSACVENVHAAKAGTIIMRRAHQLAPLASVACRAAATRRAPLRRLLIHRLVILGRSSLATTRNNATTSDATRSANWIVLQAMATLVAEIVSDTHHLRAPSENSLSKSHIAITHDPPRLSKY